MYVVIWNRYSWTDPATKQVFTPERNYSIGRFCAVALNISSDAAAPYANRSSQGIDVLTAAEYTAAGFIISA